MSERVYRSVIYKLYPNAEQEALMMLHCRATGAMFNYLLNYCKKIREEGSPFPTMFNMVTLARAYRKENEWMDQIYANCMNAVVGNLKKGIENYFDRKKCGLKAGFPRYKTENRMDSFTYPDRFRFANEKDRLKSLHYIKLPKIGFVKYRNDFVIPGRMMTATVFRRREGTKQSWYVRIQYEILDFQYVEKNLECPVEPIGIDMGLITRIAFSDGECIPVNTVYTDIERKIAKESRKLESMPRCSKQYLKQRGKIGRIYKKAHNKMNNENHHISRYVVFRNNPISMEALQPDKMIQEAYSKTRRKLYRDASWGELTRMIQYKAADAGVDIIFVNPMNTSQICSRCGEFVEKEEQDRVHSCPVCGFTTDRDVNGAINVNKIGLGLQTLGPFPKSSKD